MNDNLANMSELEIADWLKECKLLIIVRMGEEGYFLDEEDFDIVIRKKGGDNPPARATDQS